MPEEAAPRRLPRDPALRVRRLYRGLIIYQKHIIATNEPMAER